MTKNYQVGSPNELSFGYIQNTDTICIQHGRIYENLYSIIRALNHEELHSILQNFVNEFVSNKFDEIIKDSFVPLDDNIIYQLKDRIWENEEVY